MKSDHIAVIRTACIKANPDIGDGTTRKGYIHMSRNSESWHVRCHGVKAFNESTEADARARMLIYLLENKLITL